MLAIPVFSLTSINYHHSGTVDVVVAVFVYTLCLLICTQSNIYRRLVAMHTIRMIHATNRMQPTETGIDDLFGKTTTKINDNVENKAHVMLTQAIRPELEIENPPKKKHKPSGFNRKPARKHNREKLQKNQNEYILCASRMCP